MIDHCNFQEWLYIGRIVKIYTTFKFSYFVVRSLLSAGGPFFVAMHVRGQLEHVMRHFAGEQYVHEYKQI